jgi:hypothetical protein
MFSLPVFQKENQKWEKREHIVLLVHYGRNFTMQDSLIKI